MALVTIQRSPSPSTDNDGTESSEDVCDGRSQIRKSLSESYFTVKGAALILPHNECTRKTTKKSHGGEMQHHLQAMLHLLRPEDTIKIAIRLEDVVSNYHRYMALVSTKGRQDTEECVILGLDCSTGGASIGLVLPVWLGLNIKLGGDGGFSLYTAEHSYLFKPVSVQAMWSAIQSLVKTINAAEAEKYIHDGLTHTWVGYYRSKVDHADLTRMWNSEGIEVFAPSSLSLKTEDEKERIKLAISQTLREVMLGVDLDETTSIELRKAVEKKMGISLAEFKSYFDEEMMVILGQMDAPSQILDFLYLGSEWNASNLEELKAKGVGYILNVTKEIDNFFMGMFQYYTVRLWDVEESDLLKHWEKTYKFICKARNNNSKVLVHCKMGISRSASTVMAFLMKDRRWSVEEAYKFVQDRRSCVKPNPGFMEQLHMYEGILTASNKREIFRSKSDQNLLEDCGEVQEDSEPLQGSFLGDSLFHEMSRSDWPMSTHLADSSTAGVAASGSMAVEEEWMAELQAGRGMTPEMMQCETDLLEAAETRSADSLEAAEEDAEVRGQGQDRVSASLEEDGAGGGGRSSGMLGCRGIKPDSSWIRPDSVDIELGPEPGETTTDEALDTALGSPPDSAMAADTSPAMISQRPPSSEPQTPTQATMFLHGATETESSDFSLPPNLNSTTATAATTNLSILAKQCPLSSSAPTTDGSSPSQERSQPVISTGGAFSDITAQPSDTTPTPTNLSPSKNDPNQMETVSKYNSITSAVTITSSSPKPPITISDNIEAADTSSSASKDALGTTVMSTSPRSAEKMDRPRHPLEIGVRQYFFREKIPWSPGKVRKMREGINKTGQLLLPGEDQVEGDGDEKGGEVPETEADSLESVKNKPGLAQSRSCVELGTLAQAGQQQDAMVVTKEGRDSLSLYEKEEIPLEPGTVRRTRKEIEERHGFTKTAEEEDKSTSRAVMRTSSLKAERTTPCLSMGDNPRSLDDVNAEGLLHSPGSFRLSLDDLRRVGGAEMKCSPSKETWRTQRPTESSIQRSNPLNLTLHISAVSTSTQPSSISTVTDASSPSIPRGNLDSDTLALIREIGSALLMSPSPGEKGKGDSGQKSEGQQAEPGTSSNLVKYFVRKIEQEQQLSPLQSPTTSALTQAQATGKLQGPCVHQKGDASPGVFNKCEDLADVKLGQQDPLSSGPAAVSETLGQMLNNSGQSSVGDQAVRPVDDGQTGRTPQTKAPQLQPTASTEGGQGAEETPTVKRLVGKFELGSEGGPAASHHLSDCSAMSTSGEEQAVSLMGFPSCKEGDEGSYSHLSTGQGCQYANTSVNANCSEPLPASSFLHCVPRAMGSERHVASDAPHPVYLSSSLSSSSSTPSYSLSKKHIAESCGSSKLPDYNIPVELVELTEAGQNSSQSQHHQQQHHASPWSLGSKPGPLPFSKQLLHDSSCGTPRTWRSVRPKSAPVSDQQPVGGSTIGADLWQSSGHHAISPTGEAEIGSVALRHEGVSGLGEEVRKKRRLHGRSFPISSSFRHGESQQQQQQQQQQQHKSRLGHGPFYSSM